MLGWYLEAGYDVLHGVQNGQRLVPFVRYERYNTHAKTAGSLAENKSFDRTDVTIGAIFCQNRPKDAKSLWED
ncbi:MAG: hypothetical protein ACK5HT_00660 [Draconibacterium sp.]